MKAVVQGSKEAIDVCVSTYTAVYPKARGQARVDVTYAQTGEVAIAEVSSGLEGSRQLAECLDGVARTWTLPALTDDRATLAVVVPIYEGARFDLEAKPEAKPEPGPPPPPLGEFTFTPGTFQNLTWGTGADNGGPLPGIEPREGPGTGTEE